MGTLTAFLPPKSDDTRPGRQSGILWYRVGQAHCAAVRFRNVPARWFVYHTFPGGFPINCV
nr:MAG TPA: hypothetical protein [Caudoviricetes sp.]